MLLLPLFSDLPRRSSKQVLFYFRSRRVNIDKQAGQKMHSKMMGDIKTHWTPSSHPFHHIYTPTDANTGTGGCRQKGWCQQAVEKMGEM